MRRTYGGAHAGAHRGRTVRTEGHTQRVPHLISDTGAYTNNQAVPDIPTSANGNYSTCAYCYPHHSANSGSYTDILTDCHAYPLS